MRESSAARKAYQDYLKQDVPRSLDRLAQSYQTRSEPAPPTRQLTTLKVWSRAHAWQDRIAAHDRALAEQAAREDADERKKARKARLGISYEAQDKVLRKLRSVPPEQMTMREAVSLLHEAWDAQRRDLGEATQRLEVSGPDGREVVVRVIYDDGNAPALDADP